MDDTYVGGKRRVYEGDVLDNKVMVLSAIQCDGAVRLRVAEPVNKNETVGLRV